MTLQKEHVHLKARRPGAGFCRGAPLSHIDLSGCWRKICRNLEILDGDLGMAVLAAKIMGKTYGARAIGTKSAGNKVATYSHTATLPPAILEKDAVGVFLLNKMPRRVCSPEGTAVSVRKSNRAIKSREFPTLLHQCGLLGRRLRLAEQGSGPDTFVTQVLRMWLADYLEACQRGKPSPCPLCGPSRDRKTVSTV